MIATWTSLTPGKRETASLIFVAQDPQSIPDTVQSQNSSLFEPDIVFPPARKRTVALIESGT
ncbi:hypothetical protein ACFOD6_18065 [Tabrizicola soli]|uniref:Uncharacterized protein n=1 Tax=Tabrizicola soli TaxID=2185115 RepID=A0ABV7DXR4_9RHOB